MSTGKIEWTWEDESGDDLVEVEIICEWYAEAPEPQSWDYPGDDGCFIIETIKDTDGNNMEDRIDESEWEKLEVAVGDWVTDPDNHYDGP